MERVLLNIILVSSYLFCDKTEGFTRNKEIFGTEEGLLVNSNRYRRSDSIKNGIFCTLPDHPENGRWFLATGEGQVGEQIDENAILLFKCNEGYRLTPNNPYVVCDNQWNTVSTPKCDVSVPKLCPDLNLGEGFNYSCKNSQGGRVSCSEADEASTLSYKCPYGFEIPQGVKSTVRCHNGSWESVPECRIEADPKAVTPKPEEETKIVCIYDSGNYQSVKPEELNASLCTHLVYHSAGLSINGNVVTLDSSSGIGGNSSLYKLVLDMKKTNTNLKILLSISGLGINEDHEFPTVAGDPVRISRLVKSVNSLLETYNFDGIDIHWHYPSAKDKKNYGALLKALRETLNPGRKLLTATVYVAPTFLGYNISAMIAYLDWIHVICYGHYNEFSKYTGQNSALYPSALENSYQEDNLNLKGCSSNWNYYGFGKGKIVVGITFLGRFYTLVNEKTHGIHAPVTGSTNSNHTGLVTYSEICQNYTHWRRVWDDEQKNPYKYYKNKWVGYDDPDSIQLKAAYLKKNRYAGVALFSIDADDVQGNCGPKQALLNQVYNVLREE